MALEDKIDALIVALNENTAVTKALAELRTEAVETVRKAAEPKALAELRTEAVETVRKAEVRKAEVRKAEAPEVRKAEAPEEDPKSEVSYEGIPELIAGYVGGTEREEERAARKAKIKELLRHDAICKPEKKGETEAFDAQDIKPDAVGLFRDQIRLLTEKGDLTQPAGAGGSLVL